MSGFRSKYNSSNYIDVRNDFGAKGNGVSDDSNAIQNAINQAQSTGMSVYIPSGSYLCTSSIEWKSDVYMFGSGPDSTEIIFNIDSNTDGLYNYTTPGSIKSYINTYISDIAFKCNNYTSVRDLVHIENMSGQIDNCIFLRASRHDFYTGGTLNAVFNRCEFNGAGSHSFYLASRPNTGTSDVFFLSTSTYFNNCYFRGSRLGSGCYIEYVLGGVFDSCIFESNGINPNGDPTDPDTYGCGIIVFQGKVSIYSPYFENNYVRDMWLGSDRYIPASDGQKNMFYVSAITSVVAASQLENILRVDEAGVVVVDGDFFTTAPTGDYYAFYPQYPINFTLNTSVGISKVKFYVQSTGLERVIDTVTFCKIRSYLDGANPRKEYLGKNTIIYSGGINLLNPKSKTSDNFNFIIRNNSSGETEVVDQSLIISKLKLSLTSSEVLSLNTSPIELLPAPGAGYIYEILNILVKVNFNTIAYTTNTNIQIYYNQNVVVGSNNTILTSLATRTGRFSLNQVSGNTTDQYPENQPLLINVASGNPTAGNSSIDVFVTYRLLNID